MGMGIWPALFPLKGQGNDPQKKEFRGGMGMPFPLIPWGKEKGVGTPKMGSPFLVTPKRGGFAQRKNPETFF